MRQLRFSVDVVMERVPVASRWVSERWQVAGVEPRDEIFEVETYRPENPEGSRWRASGLPLELHPSEAEGYFLNLTAPDPKFFVMWRLEEPGSEPPIRVVVVTVSYNQAARSLDAGEQVDAIPLPLALAEWMRPFVDEHYRPEPKRKNRRNDPFADAAQSPAGNKT